MQQAGKRPVQLARIPPPTQQLAPSTPATSAMA